MLWAINCTLMTEADVIITRFGVQASVLPHEIRRPRAGPRGSSVQYVKRMALTMLSITNDGQNKSQKTQYHASLSTTPLNNKKENAPNENTPI